MAQHRSVGTFLAYFPSPPAGSLFMTVGSLLLLAAGAFFGGLNAQSRQENANVITGRWLMIWFHLVSVRCCR